MNFLDKISLIIKEINLIFFTTLTLACFLSTSSHALSPEPKLKNETQEQRAMSLFLEVRCLVCNGQVIENSDTAFSFEMRQLIRKKIESGMSNEEIKIYLKDTFGPDILTEINLKGFGILLWLSPILFGLILILLNFRFFKKNSH